MKAKIKISSEFLWVLGMILLPLAVTLCTKADLGMSMIAAPTYIVSEKTILSYGQTEYIFQAIVLIVMCLIVGKFKWVYLTSFASAVIYGTVLDFFIWLMRDVEATTLVGRILFLAGGMVITSFAIACFIKTYLPPCSYDYLVREVVNVRKLELRKVKLTNDFTYLALSFVLSLALFKGFVGVYWGTIVMAILNGNLISFFSKLIDKHFNIVVRLPKLQKIF